MQRTRWNRSGGARLSAVLLAFVWASPLAAEDARYRIQPSQLAKVQREALLGDAKAAQRMLSHAALGSNSAAEGGDTTYWLTVAAENGSRLAQYNLGVMLLGRTDERDRLRAEYWLERAAKRGDRSASRLLKRVRKGELSGALEVQR